MSILQKVTFSKSISKTFINLVRNLSFSPKLNVKEIKEIKKENDLVISGEIVSSGREPYLVKSNHTKACPICASGLDIKHTDVLILNQFVRSDGCMLPRRITRLCRSQQKRMSSVVTMAHKAGNNCAVAAAAKLEISQGTGRYFPD